MSNKTIYGCRDINTGIITFEGEACDSGDYMGCRVETGVHAGQIAVTINDENCNDTYYGCINRTTGQFEISIPDDCCYSAWDLFWVDNRDVYGHYSFRDWDTMEGCAPNDFQIGSCFKTWNCINSQNNCSSCIIEDRSCKTLGLENKGRQVILWIDDASSLIFEYPSTGYIQEISC